MDPDRVIAEDLSHSNSEKRYYCFGKIWEGILTVRFTYLVAESGYSGPAIGAKANRFMSTKIKYTDEQIGPLKVVPDFLPAPEELVFKENTVKVTIALSKESVEFFKQEAKKHHTQYQKMIRRLLDAYTSTHKKTVTKPSSRHKKHAAER